MSFTNLKRNRNKISELVSAAEAVSGNKNFGDDRIWKPTVDKAGNGYAVIRFLPAPEGNELPWVQYWDHGFQGPSGQWYIERSLTSIGKDDPVSDYNSKLWNSVSDDKAPEREQVRRQKRRLHYVSNILVLSDSSNPENEGKVFLFQYGKKIFDKIMDSMQPQFDDETPVNPFDFWEGANFKLKIRNVEGFRNYDKSEFDSPSQLDEDEKLEEIYNKLYDLNEFTDPANYKSYAELEAKMNRVLNITQTLTTKEEVDLDLQEDAPSFKEKPSALETSSASTEEDEDLKYFASLVDDE